MPLDHKPGVTIVQVHFNINVISKHVLFQIFNDNDVEQLKNANNVVTRIKTKLHPVFELEVRTLF